MSDEIDKECVAFVGKFARSYINHAALLETVLGLGDAMFEEYEKLSDEAKTRTCKWCASVIANKFLPDFRAEAQREAFEAARKMRTATRWTTHPMTDLPREIGDNSPTYPTAADFIKTLENK